MAAAAVKALIDEREAARPVIEMGALGCRSAAALVDLHAALAHDGTFAVFAAALPELPETGDSWYAASRRAAQAHVDDPVGRALAFLLGERSTSWAKDSPSAVALAIAAAETYGVRENGVTDASPRQIVDAARRFAATHAAAIRVFLDAQRELTAQLFAGASRLCLFRGERRSERAPDVASMQVELRPLSSWTTSPETARGLTEAPDAAGGGAHVWILSAEVPIDRILATSVTGFGAPFETELVLSGGRPGDSCGVSVGSS